MKIIMLENAVTPHSHLKSSKEMDEQLKIHRRDPLLYDNYQHLLKLAVQNHDQTNKSNQPRVTFKVCNHDLMSKLTETSNSSEEICDIDLPDPVIITNMMSRRGSSDRFNKK